MNADDLYNELAGNAWKLAAQSTLDADDIRQELYLMCMEVAEGRSAYTPMIGGVHEYIMGSLWGFIRRWHNLQLLDDLIGNDVDDDKTILLAELHVLSTEDVLIRDEELIEQDALDIEESRQMRKRTQNQSTLEILVQDGYWTIRQAANFCGLSKSAIQKIRSAYP
ncbi:hypothetical protein [Ferrovum myxofaciens]|uniref:hypothetical protein n=1 Tax=Ferrovum myxofaciens TaxID=416213 RepID=UPI0004E12EEC|nr:hypothetical protein [Ferrovum myxofaciens]